MSTETKLTQKGHKNKEINLQFRNKFNTSTKAALIFFAKTDA